jgi:hypothetical protein
MHRAPRRATVHEAFPRFQLSARRPLCPTGGGSARMVRRSTGLIATEERSVAKAIPRTVSGAQSPWMGRETVSGGDAC